MFEEEWIVERQVSATATSGAPDVLEAAKRVERTVIHRAAFFWKYQSPGHPTETGEQTRPPNRLQSHRKGSSARLGSKA